MRMFHGWMALGGQEIVNNERFAVYARLLGLPTVRDEVRCPGLAAVLADDPYETAGLAGAPWADDGVPESGGFAGVYVLGVTGLDASTATRTVTVLADSGGIPAAQFNGPRTVAVTAFLAADSPAALSYGLAWLDSALRDDCTDRCAGDTLCLLGDCPTCPAGTEELAAGCWEDQVRTLHDVTVVDGPKVVQLHQLSGGCGDGRAAGATIEFTLIAGVPHIYRAPAAVADPLTFIPPPAGTGCDVEWLPVGAGRGSCPPEEGCGPPLGGALVDPALPAVPAMPLPPRGALACVSRLRSAWAAATAAAGLTPHWFDAVPVVTVKAGGADMRRLTVRFYANPLLTVVADPGDLDRCAALTELNITYLPRDTTLVLDGRAQEAYVLRPGGVRQSADAVLYGPDGGPFEWPVLACGTAVTVLALVDEDHYDPGATVQVSLAARQDVA